MYQVITVPDNAADLVEQLGTKPKFWFTYNERRCLFKEGRPGTGENWAEKVACELCELLGIPHARYDLAIWKGRKGVVTPSFVPKGGRLVHGNELLARALPTYPRSQFYGVRLYSLRLVMHLLRNPYHIPIGWNGFPGVSTAVDVFVGYLMLDAWIGNQDRHHQNVSLVVVVSPERSISLAPTYDHASSLGRNESDENRRDRLATRDKRRSMERYVERARSAFYSTSPSRKPLTTLNAFWNAARMRPDAAKAWMERLANVTLQDTKTIFDNIPANWITDVAIEFAQKMLELNRARLFALRGELR